MLRLRESVPADFDELWRIDQECFAPGISYSRQELAYYMRLPGSFTLVGEVEGKPGIASFLVAAVDRRGAGHIITLDVVAQARRQGLGSRLLAAAEERLRAAGCGRVRLETAVDNLTAIAFYKRHDYAVVRTIPRYYQGSVDALVMAKALA